MRISSAAAIDVVLPLMFLSTTARAFATKATARATPSQSFLSKTARAASTMTAVDRNPLLEQDDLPKFKSMEPENLTPAVETLLEKLDKEFEEFGGPMNTDLATKRI